MYKSHLNKYNTIQYLFKFYSSHRLTDRGQRVMVIDVPIGAGDRGQGAAGPPSRVDIKSFFSGKTSIFMKYLLPCLKTWASFYRSDQPKGVKNAKSINETAIKYPKN